MKKLLVLFALLSQGCATIDVSKLTPCEEKVYFGIGHKLHQHREYYLYHSPREGLYKVKNSGVSGRYGAFIDCEDFRVGYDHMSDFFKGEPIGEGIEYATDEYYIDYIYSF